MAEVGHFPPHPLVLATRRLFVGLYSFCVLKSLASCRRLVSSRAGSAVDFSARQENAGLRPGLYTVKSASTTTACKGSFLSYSGSGRVKMQSSTAKNPMQWVVLPKSSTSLEYTLTPARGGKARLSYSKSCSS